MSSTGCTYAALFVVQLIKVFRTKSDHPSDKGRIQVGIWLTGVLEPSDEEPIGGGKAGERTQKNLCHEGVAGITDGPVRRFHGLSRFEYQRGIFIIPRISPYILLP